MNASLAWKATQTLLIAVGSVETVAFAATLQWWLIIALGGSLALTWGLLYKMLAGIAGHGQIQSVRVSQ